MQDVQSVTTSKTLRQLMVRALRNDGFGALCKEEEKDYAVGGQLFSVGLFFVLYLSSVLFAGIFLSWGVWPTAAYVFGFLLVCVVLNIALGLSLKVPYLTLLGTALASLGFLILTGRTSEILLTHAAPVVIVFAVVWGYRAVLLLQGIPFFIPVALIIVLAPLLTEDPWRLATAAGLRLGWLALAALTPLTVLLLLRISKVDSFEATKEEARKLLNSDVSVEQSVNLAKRQLVNGEKYADDVDSVTLDGWLRLRLSLNHLQALHEAASRRIQRRAQRRAVSLIVGVGVASYAFIYVLAIAGMPENLANEWSGSTTSYFELPVWPHLQLPLAPYTSVALLFSILALAGFLAFSLTEEQYGSGLTQATHGFLARRLLLAGLPYYRLTKPGTVEDMSDRESNSSASADPPLTNELLPTPKSKKKPKKKRR